MSSWRNVHLRSIKNLSTLNYAKLNVIQQEIADKFEKNKLTWLEVFLILKGMKNKEMVNYEKAKNYYKWEYEAGLKAEGIDIDTFK